MSSGSQESRVRERTLEKWTPRLLLHRKTIKAQVSSQVCACVSVCAYTCVPMDSRADDTKRDAQVDGGPIRTGFSAVAALPVPRDRLDLVQRLAALVLLIAASSSSPASHSARRHRAAALSLITTHTNTGMRRNFLCISSD